MINQSIHISNNQSRQHFDRNIKLMMTANSRSAAQRSFEIKGGGKKDKIVRQQTKQRWESFLQFLPGNMYRWREHIARQREKEGQTVKESQTEKEMSWMMLLPHTNNKPHKYTNDS